MRLWQEMLTEEEGKSTGTRNKQESRSRMGQPRPSTSLTDLTDTGNEEQGRRNREERIGKKFPIPSYQFRFHSTPNPNYHLPILRLRSVQVPSYQFQILLLPVLMLRN